MTVSNKQPPAVSLGNLTSADARFQRDPDGVIATLRGCPFHVDAISNDILVTDYEAARALLTDRDTSRDRAVEHGGRSTTEQTSLMRLDDPDHARLRKPMLTTLTARTKRFRSVIRHHVQQAIEPLEDGVPFDVVSGFAQPLASQLIASLLGVNEAQRDDLMRWMVDISLIFELSQDAGQDARFMEAYHSLSSFLKGSAAARRSRPGDDWISDLVGSSDMTDEEIMMNLRITVVGALMPLSALISNAVRLLLVNPPELARLREDPAMAGVVVEETLRFEPPVEMTSRGSHRGVEVAGQAIAPFREMEVVVRAANHDPAVFADPDVFSLSHGRRPHLSFGAGSRMCIGASFSRQAAEMAIGALVGRFPSLSLVDAAAEPVWRLTPLLRSLESLEVVGFA